MVGIPTETPTQGLLTRASNDVTVESLYDLLPIYIINSPSSPPPCPCDTQGAPLILFGQAKNSMMMDVEHEYAIAADYHQDARFRSEVIKTWWTRWHDTHPYEPAPPHYVQINPEYRPETVITREEFNPTGLRACDLLVGPK